MTMKICWKFSIVIAICGILASCSNTKYLPANEALYTGAKVNLEGKEASKRKKKLLKGELEALTRPRPNSAILGLRIKLWLHNIAGNPKKKNSPAAIIKRWGEPPVLLSEVNLENNIEILKNNLENRGFFHAAVTGDTIVKNKRARAEYVATVGPLYTIADVIFDQDSGVLESEIRRVAPRSMLKENDAYDLDLVKAERDRIDARLKQRGFYFFSPDFLIMRVDSTIGDHKVNIYVDVKPQTPAEARRKYSINDVYVYSNYSLNTIEADTSKEHAKLYGGYYVVDSANFYKPRLFQQALQFQPGERYNRRDHNLTLNRLMNLNVFKFVKNRFEPVSDTLLDTYYYLTPLPKKSLRAELGGLTKSNNLTGTQATVGFTNRNTFGGGEILRVDVSGGAEVQFSGQFPGYNIYRLGAEANLAFPRFMVPFVTINTHGGFVPRTNFQLGYDLLNRQRLYTLNSFRGGFGYLWKESVQKEHQFYPISVQYVRPMNVTDEYRQSIANNPTLQRAVDTQFILGANYNYLLNQLVGRPRRNTFYFSGLLDASGNIAGLLTGADAKQGDPSRIFGLPFSQYLKTEADFRFYRRFTSSTSPNMWANRIIVGAGFPYGNSTELPFIKQFFIGGNNSLRGFRSRALGPGTFQAEPIANTNFLPDQAGDLKLELNSELRMKLFSVVHGALFVDAGNIWLYNESDDRPGGAFTTSFMKELAVDAGVGIRIDISVLVLRLDVAFPLRKPWLPETERWVFDDIRFGDGEWRRENVIFNLGIGYPF